MNFINFQTLQTQNEKLKQELAQLEEHKKNLEAILNNFNLNKNREDSTNESSLRC